VAVTKGSAAVTPDVTAAAAITAGATAYSTIPQRQFRIGLGNIYGIISWSGGTLTLDRPYSEDTNAAATYRIAQYYYAAPYQDHRMFISVRNMELYRDLFLDKNREWVNHTDPQRSFSNWPTHCVLYKIDSESTSPTYGYPLFELWGLPTEEHTYSLYGIRNMPDLSADTDTLPVQMSEDIVIERAKYYAFQWAEANKDSMGLGGESDFKFLMGEANKEYTRLVTKQRMHDRELVNLWTFDKKVTLLGSTMGHYNTRTGYAGSGRW
jgi:hypothetical protein